MTTLTSFGPDTPLDALPLSFRRCLPPNVLTPAQQSACDAIVGSITAGTGYCSVAPFTGMTYCGCVNNSIPCPMIAATACANSASAFQPTAMRAPDGQAYLACKGRPVCVNLVEVGGSQNVVKGVTQQCGDIQNFRTFILANPALLILVILLVIMLAVLSGLGSSVSAAKTPPPKTLTAAATASTASTFAA